MNEWLKKFDRFAKFYNWKKAKNLGAIVLLFDSPALSWSQTLPEETVNTFNGIVEALKSRFDASNMDLILKMVIKQRKEQKQAVINGKAKIYTEAR